MSCGNGHRYDVNKRGYLTTLDRKAGITGDTRSILEARAAFLSLGHYSPIARRLDGLIFSRKKLRIIDSGCGTGYYLGHLLHTRVDPEALAVDASSDAVAMTVSGTSAVGLVADVWKPLPIRSDAADVVLCVFAPRHAAEFARVLRADGQLVIVTPQPGHLRQLREVGSVLAMQNDKQAALDSSLGVHFRLDHREQVAYDIDLTAAQAALLTGMGPAGHHDRVSDYEGPVDIAVDISVYTPLGS